MAFEKLKWQAKGQVYLFFLSMYFQLLRYGHTLYKPIEWIENLFSNYSVNKKVERELRKIGVDVGRKEERRPIVSNVKREFLDYTGKDVVSVVFQKKATKWWRRGRKFTFLIRPLGPEDLVDVKDLMEVVRGLIAKGTSEEQAALQYANSLQERLNKMDPLQVMNFLLEKASIYPKIVDKEEPVKDDELPILKIPLDMKTALVEKILAISPVFNVKKA